MITIVPYTPIHTHTDTDRQRERERKTRVNRIHDTFLRLGERLHLKEHVQYSLLVVRKACEIFAFYSYLKEHLSGSGLKINIYSSPRPDSSQCSLFKKSLLPFQLVLLYAKGHIEKLLLFLQVSPLQSCRYTRTRAPTSVHDVPPVVMLRVI